MFSPKSIVALVLAANVVLSVPTWRRNNFPSHSEWKSKNLESYYKFKIRYRHLGCSEVEGTDFYNQCCVPLPKGEAPTEQCTPSSCSAYTPVPQVPTATEAPAPAPTETHDGSDYGGNGGNDGEDDCEDDDETGDDSNLPYCDEVDGDYEPVTPTSGYPQEPTTAAPAPEETAPTEPEPEPTTTTEPAAPAPEETTPTEPEPEPTTTEPEPTPAAPDNNNNGGGGEVNTGGFATFYEQDGSEGACGGFHGDNEYIGAMDERRYGVDSVRSSECGRRVRITNDNNGKSVEIVIVDDCPTCENANSIDLSPTAFEQIATREEGMVPISWVYLS